VGEIKTSKPPVDWNLFNETTTIQSRQFFINFQYILEVLLKVAYQLSSPS